jgi:transposase
MAYSKDLRERALQAVRNGQSKAAVSRMFGLGENTIRNWEKLEEQTGSLDKKPLVRTSRKINRIKLLNWYKKNPLATNEETAIEFNCSVSGIRSAKEVLKITRKKTPSDMQNAMSKNGKNLSQK